MTKIKSLFWLGVIGAVAVLGVSMLGDDLPSFRAAPRNHTPPHVYAVDDKRPRVIRLRIDYAQPDFPTRAFYSVSGAQVALLASDFVAGSWQRDLTYDPSKTYMVEAYQRNPQAKATSCLIKVIDPGGFGFDDSEAIQGSGTARCWVNPAK